MVAVTSATLTLTDFLLARIAEAERVAECAARLGADTIGHDCGEPGYGGYASAGDYEPARVLAQCEAYRQIVDLHAQPGDRDLRDGSYYSMYDPSCSGAYGDDVLIADCDTLRALAAVYADHPDYREEWRN